MDHSEAQQSHAAERYILNEMTAGERDGFEEHFFDCRLCAKDVTDGAKLVAAGRRVALSSQPVVPISRRWTAWLPAAAAAVLVIIAAAIGVPRGSSPSLDLIHHTITIEAGTSRATAEPPQVIARGQKTILSVDVPPDPPFPRYEIHLRDAKGRDVVDAQPVTADEAKDPIQLLSDSLPAGSFILTIEGVREDGNRTEIVTREITVR